MPTTSSYEQCANALKTIIDTEFAAEGLVAIHDELHESLGSQGTVIGISTDERGDVVNAANGLVLETWIQVRFQGGYNLQVNPSQTVDPRIITNYAERLRRAIRTANSPHFGTSQAWYYQITEIRYPRDPTGNKTRFFATIRAYGNNSALVETTG
jgi:hypothetical protein